MSAPHIPPPPPLSKRVTDESQPKDERIRIGIEIEGVGTVRTNWDRPAVIEQDNFHDVFKRTPLVRSNSFTSVRGVYITPEDADTFGTQSPAELVSSPHVLDGPNLFHLRNSVWKALRKADAPKTGTARFSDPRSPTPAGPVAQSRWARSTVRTIGGSLQTTIGVAVSKLLADSATPRAAVVDLLVGDLMKAGKVKDLCRAAVLAQQHFTSAGEVLDGCDAGEQRYGVRLALFMAFILPAVQATNSGGANGVWAKDFLGCNFKAQTSFAACGLDAAAVARFPMAVFTPARRTTLKTGLLSALRTGGAADWICAALDSWLDVSRIGQPGRSVQTDVEGWFAIPNFLNQGHLYTVIECREKEADLNQRMAAFLNTAQPGKPPQPAEASSLEGRAVLAKATTLVTELKVIVTA